MFYLKHSLRVRERKTTFLKIAATFVLLVFACTLVSPQITNATIYQPGETLEPDCAPGSANCGVVTNSLSLGTTTSIGNSLLSIQATSTNSILATLRAFVGQTADLFRVENSAGSRLFSINAGGKVFASSTLQVSDTLTTYGILDIQATGTSTFTGGIFANTFRTNLPSCTQALETDVNGAIVCGMDATAAAGTNDFGTFSTYSTGKNLTSSSTYDILVQGELNVDGAGTSTMQGNLGIMNVLSVGSASSTIRGTTATSTLGGLNANHLTVTKAITQNGNGTSTFTGGIYANAFRFNQSSCTSALETDSTGAIICGTDDTGAGSGIATIQENDVDVVTSAATIDFLGIDFVVGAAGTEGNVSIDYTNAGITRVGQNEVITGAWRFNKASSTLFSNVRTAYFGGTATSTFDSVGALSLNTAGVKLTGNTDGALTFLGLGNGNDEDLTLDLDNTANTGVFTSATGLATINFSSIALQESGNAVVNVADLISGDGAGGTSSGSGLEADTGRIGLLQGCANNEVLKWNEAGSIWGCGSSSYSKFTSVAYTNVLNSTGNTADVGATDVDVTTQTAADATQVLLGYDLVFTVQSNGDAWQAHVMPNGTAQSVDNIIGMIEDNDQTAAPFVDDGGEVIVSLDSGQIFDYSLDELVDGGTVTYRLGVLGYWSPVTTGADLAEYYYASEQLQPGDVVSFDPTYSAGVKKTSGRYDEQVLGVISTAPGMVLGDVPGVENGVRKLSEDEARKLTSRTPYPVALAGRVPVNVSIENGPIEVGDYLTPSSVPGVAMKATKAGQVLGRSLFEYDHDGEIGAVMMYVNNTYHQDQNLTDVIEEVAVLLGDITPKVNVDGLDNGLSTLVATIQTETAHDPIAIIMAKIVDGTQFLTDFIAARVTAIRGYFDEIFAKKVHTEQICVKKSDGSEACMNGDELRSLLQNTEGADEGSATITPVINESPSTNEVPSNNPEPQPALPLLSADDEGAAAGETIEMPDISPAQSEEAIPPEPIGTETPVVGETSPPPEHAASESSVGVTEQPASPAPIEVQS